MYCYIDLAINKILPSLDIKKFFKKKFVILKIMTFPNIFLQIFV